jgi:hypothetical protein
MKRVKSDVLDHPEHVPSNFLKLILMVCGPDLKLKQVQEERIRRGISTFSAFSPVGSG